MKPENYEELSPRTREELIAALEEHDRQQRRQLFFRQLGSSSPRNRYLTVRHRATQRVSLRAMAVWLLGYGYPMQSQQARSPDRLELAM